MPKEPGVPRLYDPSVHNDDTRVLRAEELEALSQRPPADGDEDEPAQTSGVARTETSAKSFDVDLDWEIPASPMSEREPPAEQSEVRVSSDVVPAGESDEVEITAGPPLELDLQELEPLPSFAMEEDADEPTPALPQARSPSPFPSSPSSSLPPVPPSAPPSSPGSVAPASGLTLTQRQSIPRVLVSPSEIAKLPIDHRGGFLLTHIDGMHTLEEILDICAMPAAEALEILRNLEAHRVIEFD